MGAGAHEGHEFEPRRDASLKMTIISRLMRRRFDQSIATRGVTRSQWALIVVVARAPGASQRDIAEGLEITEAAAGRLIERLCADGLLERRVDAGDKRARRVYLTAKSEPLLAILSEAGLVVEDAAFAGFAVDEIVELQRLLDKIYGNLAEVKA